MISESHGGKNADAFPQSQPNFFRIPPIIGAEYIPRVTQPLPTDFQMRLRERLAALKLSANAASMKAELSRETVRKLLEPGAGLPRGGTLNKLADALETTVGYLLGQDDSPAKAPGAAAPIEHLSYSDDDVEIKAVAAGSYEGAFQLFDNAMGHTARPRGLKRHTNVYALVVLNDSMIPEHKPGEVKFATPDIKPKLGESVVIEFVRDPDRGPEAMIGYLKKNAASVVIEKLNPPGEVEIDSQNVIRLHRLAPYSEMR